MLASRWLVPWTRDVGGDIMSGCYLKTSSDESFLETCWRLV